MKYFKKIKILMLCLSMLGIAPNIWALKSYDVSGYHILSTLILPDAPQFPIWKNNGAGKCPGISFPASISPGEIPSAINEITIDPKSIVFPYSCSTVYSENLIDNQSCLVSIELTVKNGTIKTVNLSATPLSGYCEAYPNNPIIFLGELV
ncbi:MAG: hypothetical protein A3C44_05275 [Gammaproteobacteria bacterium RIFCSPHIGHO2_02_FULL_39_13]|nr:MAG: hypothetical protein A3C44_05275 [Gammaproteobacteria bacterium RIFCSPHIGHO2_02_FULL_39_13]OGT50625.1 MAG: hypothetical protein A3E53_02815 [Gammaproteobacteria bacterium RIFCSPHIGHO2_12_FULL_39_24]